MDFSISQKSETVQPVKDNRSQHSLSNQKPKIFTSHQDNSRIFEEHVCEEFQVLCSKIEENKLFKVTIHQVKNKKLSPELLITINNTWIKVGLQNPISNSGGTTRIAFTQEPTFEMDFVFVIEHSEAGKSLDSPPPFVEETFMGQYKIQFPVPSINLVEISIESSSSILAKKIERISRHSLLIKRYPSSCFEIPLEIDDITFERKHPYAEYPLTATLVTNNDVARGLINFTSEFNRLSLNKQFSGFMKLLLSEP